MKTSVLMTPLKALNPSRITGPIFDKELRVSSRRKRNYLLRFAYLAILLAVILFIWEVEVHWGMGSLAYQSSMLHRAGLMITAAVVIFQFYAAQILSVIMLSNSISDEVYNKTLGALMSTPINSFQIVMGKLLSKLLQIALLICLTLPILGIVRVFGGVPWDFLLRSLCITFTAVIFAGMVSLNLSIGHKHTYVVIILAFIRLVILYIAIPIFAVWVACEYFGFGLFGKSFMPLLQWIAMVNPLLLMQIILSDMFNPGTIGSPMFGWGWHCLFMLALSAILFIRAIIVVRKKALQQACGQSDAPGRKWKFWRTSSKDEKIRRIKGNPLVWKELRKTSFDMAFRKKVIAASSIIACLLFSYYMCIKGRMLDDSETHIMYCEIFMVLGIFIATVFSATSITADKISRSLPVLLTTLITDWKIVMAKAIGVFRRTVPVWSLLFVHIIIFILLKNIHPSALIQVVIIVSGAMMFVVSSGIFFSSRFKHTTGAVVANLVFVAIVWGGIPFVALILSLMFRAGDDLIELVMAFNPFFHIGMVMDEVAGHGATDNLSQMKYDCLIMRTGFWGTTTFLAFVAAGYSAVSLLFLKLAKRNLRRKLF